MSYIGSATIEWPHCFKFVSCWPVSNEETYGVVPSSQIACGAAGGNIHLIINSSIGAKLRSKRKAVYEPYRARPRSSQ